MSASTADKRFAQTPKPPYYAVIFTSTRTAVDEGYGAVADRMVALAAGQPGFLGVESTRGADGLGVLLVIARCHRRLEIERGTSRGAGVGALQVVRTLRDPRGAGRTRLPRSLRLEVA